MHTSVRRRTLAAFTLIELLTVIAIIGILAAIIIPTVGSVRQSAQASACLSNLRQVGMSAILYANDNKGRLPDAGLATDPQWARTLSSYLSVPVTQRASVFVCPGTAIPVEDSPNTTDVVITYGMHGGLMPLGQPAMALDRIKRQSEVILAADMCQDPNNRGWTPFSIEQPSIFVSQSGGRGGSIDLDEFISTATDNDTGNNRWMRYRHKGSVNVVRVDGSATAYRKGEIRNRHAVFTE
jgi:prepilin-type N-terminal cleavage/methylation domain-containing protein/prepilin-type processing-associated H-X9-DG protein